MRLAARAEACAVVCALASQHEDAFASEKLLLWHAAAARRDGRAGVAAAAGAGGRASDFAVVSVPLRALLWRLAASRHAPLAAQALAALRGLLLPLLGQSPPLLLGSGHEEAKALLLRQARPQALGPLPSLEPEPNPVAHPPPCSLPSPRPRLSLSLTLSLSLILTLARRCSCCARCSIRMACSKRRVGSAHPQTRCALRAASSSFAPSRSARCRPPPPPPLPHLLRAHKSNQRFGG